MSPGGETLAGWKGELCRALQRVGVLAGSSSCPPPPRGNGRREEGASAELSCGCDEECEVQRWDSRASSMLRAILWSCRWFVSQKSSRIVWRGRAFALRARCSPVCAPRMGDVVCNVRCMLLNTGDTQPGDTGVTMTAVEGAESQMARVALTVRAL